MNISNKNDINIKNKNIVIIGIGRSGVGAAKLARYLGANVLISDYKSNIRNVSLSKKMQSIDIKTELGGHSEEIYNADLWILSPGISKNNPIIIKAKNKSLKLISEIEFASWFTNALIIALTGSNGKTTTVHLLNEMCNNNEHPPALGGNVGIAFSELVLSDLENKTSKRIYILEISSFQMEHIIHFKPHISIFLNISKDHMDRYSNMNKYIEAKLNMIQNQDENDYIVYNIDDQILNKKFIDSISQIHGFSLIDTKNTKLKVDSTKIYDEAYNTIIELNKIALLGKHNLSNILAAATAAKILGVPNSEISKAIKAFQGVEHRLERVIKIKGVTYYNDSKATNVDSVKVALESFDNSIYLILGGKDKGGDFSEILPYLQNKVKEIILYGEAANIIAAAIGDAVKLEKLFSLKDAVKACYLRAKPGDVVLLSPGCASFDQFRNFEERGNIFKSILNSMAN